MTLTADGADFPVMTESDYLKVQARKCRTLASGLSNRDDVRKLEDLALELEHRARGIDFSEIGRLRAA